MKTRNIKTFIYMGDLLIKQKHIEKKFYCRIDEEKLNSKLPNSAHLNNIYTLYKWNWWVLMGFLRSQLVCLFLISSGRQFQSSDHIMTLFLETLLVFDTQAEPDLYFFFLTVCERKNSNFSLLLWPFDYTLHQYIFKPV